MLIYTLHDDSHDTPALVDVFMPRDDALDTEDNEMNVTDHELEEVKCFHFMNKMLKNCL